MVHEMDSDRIEKWQCIFCGSRSKKVGEIKASNKKIIGRSLICCNCGHIENFALDVNAIPIYMGISSRGVSGVDIKCGISPDSKLKCNLDVCDIGVKNKCICSEEKPTPVVAKPKCETPATDFVAMPKIPSSGFATPHRPSIAQSEPPRNDLGQMPVMQPRPDIRRPEAVHSDLTAIPNVIVGKNKYN